jgi:ethanolamine utilization protein EutA (predicted chaperonin)
MFSNPRLSSGVLLITVQDDANADAQDALNAFSTGQGDHLCSTLTPDDDMAESVDIACK